jgi:hypothetical protein
MAAGMMYIANSFKTVGRTARERGNWPVDNDPHFWQSPPTWGICRNDLRKKATAGQTLVRWDAEWEEYEPVDGSILEAWRREGDL